MVGLMDGNHEVGAESSANWKLIAEIASGISESRRDSTGIRTQPLRVVSAMPCGC
jgi:hypothetical protein